jgi:hypothetical protein
MQNELIPFWCIDIQLLQEGYAYCYIIILLLYIRTMYIGQAFSLVNGLYQHNQGISRLQTYNQMESGWFGSDLCYLRAGTFSLLGEVTRTKDRHLKNLTRTWWNVSQMQQASHKHKRKKILSHFYQLIY